MTATTCTADTLLPPRGTRPRNRRDLILAAASHLFYEHGYGQVSMRQIASAVGVTRAALYRHVPGKAELLYELVDDAIDVFDALLVATAMADVNATLELLAEAALDHREIGVLLQRESRNLSGPDQVVLREKANRCVRRLADRLRDARPALSDDQAELLVLCALNAMMSVSFHHLDLPRSTFVPLLVEVGSGIFSLELADIREDEAPLRTPAEQHGRRDQLLAAAMTLFAARGFAAVSIDDIGDAVGIAGPSVYNHFSSKQGLLMAALGQAGDELIGSTTRQPAAAAKTEASLRRLTDEYVDMALDHSDTFTVLITEAQHLSADDRGTLRTMQRDFTHRWVRQLRGVRPSESPTSARIKVQAAQMVANDVGRSYRLRAAPGFREAVREVCWTIQS